MESQLNHDLMEAVNRYVLFDDLISYGVALDILDELHDLHGLTTKEVELLKIKARQHYVV